MGIVISSSGVAVVACSAIVDPRSVDLLIVTPLLSIADVAIVNLSACD
jgi:hypothetical protein